MLKQKNFEMFAPESAQCWSLADHQSSYDGGLGKALDLANRWLRRFAPAYIAQIGRCGACGGKCVSTWVEVRVQWDDSGARPNGETEEFLSFVEQVRGGTCDYYPDEF